MLPDTCNWILLMNIKNSFPLKRNYKKRTQTSGSSVSLCFVALLLDFAFSPSLCYDAVRISVPAVKENKGRIFGVSSY